MLKNIFLSIVLVVICLQLDAQYKYMGTFNWEGKPDYLLPKRDTLSSEFKAKIAATLPESRKVNVYNPQLISDTRPELFEFKCETDVWITFYDEGASYMNVLGYYTYNLNNPPSTAPASGDITIIFPNASKSGAGGALNQGDKVYLGKFSANTGLGFVLLANGWNGAVVGNGLWKLYSNSKFNPEADSSLRKHTVLLNDTASGKIVIGFEDVKRDLSSCDHDFNDVLFYVTLASKPCVNKLDSIPILNVDGKVVFSGSTGGVESKSIGDILVKRMVHKAQNNENGAINYQLLQPIQPITTPKKDVYGIGIVKSTTGISGNTDLSALLPEQVLDSGYIAFNTSPADLTTFTNAKDVRAIDFTFNNTCRAVAFVTRTSGEIYSHTKAICDRLREGSIISMETFVYEGLPFLRYAINRGGGTIEYATSFSIGSKTGRDTLTFQSKWLTDTYTTEENMLNYQLWAATPYLVTDMIVDLIAKLKAVGPVVPINNSGSLPSAYIISGKRENGNLLLSIKNNASATNAFLEFNDKANEQSPIVKRTVAINLPQNGTNSITVPVADIYESNIALVINAKTQDLVYMGDGAWSVDYESGKTTLTKFVTTNNSQVSFNNQYPVFRNVGIEATTSTYIAAYKLLRGGGLPADISAFKTLRFTATGGNNLKITLIKNSIANWNNQYSVRIPLNTTAKEYLVGLEQFTSPANTPINANDITTIVFTIEVADGKSTSIKSSFSNISFVKETKDYLTNLESKEIRLFPNPAKSNFTCTFYSKVADTCQLQITEAATGRIVYTQKLSVISGLNQASANLPSYIVQPGLYVVSVSSVNVRYASKYIILTK